VGQCAFAHWAIIAISQRGRAATKFPTTRESRRGTARQAANKGIQPRISRMARIRKDGFSIREIREIRGKKSSRKFVMPLP
jgi:hypothetical protein